MGISICKLTKSYGEKQILRNADMIFRSGARYCLSGPSGCGKTTLLRLLLGLEKPDAGEIRPDPGTRFSVHFQDNRLLPWYTVKRNLSLTENNPERIRDFLQRAGLQGCEELYPEELSGGMKRRVSLIRALMDDGDILILDEPVRELDDEAADRMLTMIDEAARGRTLILVTHDGEQAKRLGCTVIKDIFEANRSSSDV